MNEQFKMSDVFVGSVALERMTSEKLKTLIDTKTACFALQDEYFWWCCNKNHAEASEIAINSYDQHIELIAKQAEQLKIMRDCIVEIRSSVLTLSEIESMCDKAINHTKLDIDKLTQAEQIKMLREAVSSSSIALSECANELNCFIDMKNSDLESSVASCTENQPDYFDAQTVHESMVVVNNLQKVLSATEQK